MKPKTVVREGGREVGKNINLLLSPGLKRAKVNFVVVRYERKKYKIISRV